MINKSFKFDLNWGKVILFFYFIAYGLFGSVTRNFFFGFPPEIALFINLSIGVIPLILFSVVLVKNPNSFIQEFEFKFYYLAIFIFFLVLGSVIQLDRISVDLFSDEYSFATSSHNIALNLLYKLSDFIELPETEFKYLVQLLSASILFSVLLVTYFLRNTEIKKTVYFVLIALIIFRISFYLIGGVGSSHPPLNLFPDYVITSVLGIEHSIFRFAHLIYFSLFITFIFSILNREIDMKFAMSVTILVFSLNPLLDIATVIEHSVWMIYFSSIFLIYFFLIEKKYSYLPLITIFSISSLMRIPIIIILFCIFVAYLLEHLNEKKFNWKNFAVSVSPIALVVPFFIKSVFLGSPAINGIGGYEIYIERIANAIEENQIITNALFSLPIGLLALMPIFVIFLKDKVKFTVFLVYLILTLVLFYSINSGLWGLYKYQLEIFLPTIVASIILLSSKLYVKKVRNIFSLLLLIIAFFNIFNFLNKDTPNNNFNPRQDIISKYNIDEAMNYIKERKLEKSSILIGSYYGLMPQILGEFKTSGIKSSKKIYDRHSALFNLSPSVIYESINRDQEIETVLIGFAANKSKLIQEFRRNQWEEVNIFNNNDKEKSHLLYVFRRSK